MKAIKTILLSIAGLVEQLLKLEYQHQYMTKHHIINDDLIYDVLIATNHCSFEVRERLYAILSDRLKHNHYTTKVAEKVANDLVILEANAVQLDEAKSSVERASTLYQLTLQVAKLQSRANLMLKSEATHRYYSPLNSTYSDKTQTSFAL